MSNLFNYLFVLGQDDVKKKRKALLGDLIVRVPLGLPKEYVGAFEKRNRKASVGKKDVHVGKNSSENVETFESTNRETSNGVKDAHIRGVTSENGKTFEKTNGNNPSRSKVVHTGSDNSENGRTSEWISTNITSGNKVVEIKPRKRDKTSENVEAFENLNAIMSCCGDIDNEHVRDKTSVDAGTSNKRNENISNGDKDVYGVKGSITRLQSSEDSDETLDPSAAENIESETENLEPMVNHRPSPQSGSNQQVSAKTTQFQNKVEQLVNESEQTLRHLVEDNVRFK